MRQETFLSRKEAAEFLKVIKPGTLAHWSSSKRYDLPYYKAGSKVLYKISDLENFLEKNFKKGGSHE